VGKKASNRPKSVQKRPSVQDQVLRRIVELKNSGMGFRKISKQLKVEGLANISRGTVSNYWKQAQTHINTVAKKLRKDPTLQTLNKTEAELQKQVDHIQMVTQARQRVRDLQLRRAETPEGRQSIFKNSQELKKFVQDTLYDSQVLKDFEPRCRADGLPLAKTLSNAIGSLDKYETENEDLFWPDLPSYIEERLDNFLLEEKQRRKKEQLQKKFSEIELNFRCPHCNATSDNMIIDVSASENRCSCGRRFKSLCVECRSALNYDNNKGVWFCKKCGAIYERPRLRLSDFTFIREPL